MDAISKVLLITLLIVTVVKACSVLLSSPPTSPLPPGPKGSLIFGNSHQLPQTEGWKTYSKWGKLYGPLVYFRIFARKFIILNTVEAVTNLLDRRSAIYSDRPQTWMFHKLCNRELTALSISSQHPWHKRYKRMLQFGLNARATESYWPLLQSEIQILLHGLRTTPERLEDHLRRNATAVIMRVAFGYTIKDENDDFLAAAQETSKITGWAMAPGRWLVDSFPILRFIPTWMPGAGFRRQAIIWSKRLDYLSRVPHEWVKAQIAKGDNVESFTSSFLCPPDGRIPGAEEEEVIKFCAGGLYAGAADTTVSCLVSFVMLMALHPDVQTRAQEEIDRVLNPGEPATHNRIEHLTYLLGVLKEVLRFAPVGPLCLPHKSIQDDTYEGLYIPKDTVIIPNVWAVMHDERYYPEPYKFEPSRFVTPLGSDKPTPEPDPRKYSFGFGARLCPAVHFAEKSMLLTMSSILANFTIEKSPEVNVDISNLECTTGHTSHIKAFRCNIRPRH